MPAAGARVREVGPRDAAPLADLLGELGYPVSPAEVARRLGRDAEHVLVAEEGGQPVGMVAVTVELLIVHAAPVARITALVVGAAARRGGVGRLLVGAAVEWARTRGCEGVELTSGIRPERAASHRFYEGLGFARTSYRFWLPLDGASR